MRDGGEEALGECSRRLCLCWQPQQLRRPSEECSEPPRGFRPCLKGAVSLPWCVASAGLCCLCESARPDPLPCPPTGLDLLGSAFEVFGRVRRPAAFCPRASPAGSEEGDSPRQCSHASYTLPWQYSRTLGQAADILICGWSK